MKWPFFLSRTRRMQIPVAVAEPDPPRSGMDYLRTRAGLDSPGDHPVARLSVARLWEASDPQPAALPTTPPEPAMSCEMFIEQAEKAGAHGDWAEAERIWRAIRTAIPDLWHCYTGGAVALSGLGRLDDARQLLTEAAVRFPQERAISLEHGRLAMARADWPAAEAQWRTALAFNVRPWWVYTELAAALEQQDRLTEAEDTLLDGQLRSDEPDEITLHTYPAQLAWKRGDWGAAVARWAEARRRFPANEELPGRHHEALLRLAEHDPAAYQEMSRQPAAAASPAGDIRELVLRFESLGGTGPDGGCEFGCFQRSCGAEPLGLLRWAAVSPASLIAALKNRFEHFGDADAISIAPHEGQWEITDTVYGTKTHSFVAITEVASDRMFALASKRMRYLKQKLIADLENPEKIFVLKAAWQTIGAADIEALGHAMRQYGPGELVCVCAADAAHAQGEVISARPGVFVGYLDFSGRLDVSSRLPGWTALCRTILGKSRLALQDGTAVLADAATG